MLTINGDGVHSVVFDFANGVNLGGDVTLGGGLTPDMVAWNFGGTSNVQLNNIASSFPNVAFQGIILASDNGISLVNANLNGRTFYAHTPTRVLLLLSHCARAGRVLRAL